MFDLLLILFTIALLFLSHLLRSIVALRIPSEFELKPLKLNRPPEVMSELFDQAERELAELGFTRGHWASFHTTPPLPGFVPPLTRLYHHPQRPIVARVTPPFTISITDRCQIVFLSISAEKTFLATANRLPELFPNPPERRAIQINADVDTIADQFRIHSEELSRRGLRWIDRAEEMGAGVWAYRLVKGFERKSIKWLFDAGHVRRLPDGTGAPTLKRALRFVWLLITGHTPNLEEQHAIAAPLAAYLFNNWRQGSRLPPPLSVQTGFYLVTAIAFGLLLGLLWDWSLALMMLAVISFHEAGHWLAMRLLGYRNLQILMLPLVGGVTLGQERSANATHRMLVSLMGPLPGILLGTAILILYGIELDWVTTLAITLLVVNYINLLPVIPLDGGQLLKAMIPKQKYGLMIGLEWFGAAVLLALAWLTDSLFPAGLALLPLFGGLTLLKRRQILTSLEQQADDPAELTPNDQIASVIQAIDLQDKRYRPLAKKVQEIDEILNIRQLMPAAPAVTGLFLCIYIASVILPPVAVYAHLPALQDLAGLLHAKGEAAQLKAYDQARELTLQQLVTELAEKNHHLYRQARSTTDKAILRAPASQQSIAAAEQRLGLRLDRDYRSLLETSNGFIDIWGTEEGKGYLFLPIEQVERCDRRLPELTSTADAEADSNTRPLVVHEYGPSVLDPFQEVELDHARLAHSLVIGNPYQGEYLLLMPAHEPGAAARLLIINEAPDRLIGRRYITLQDYLASELAILSLQDNHDE